MKSFFLNILVKINLFIQHIINMGINDGIKFYFLKTNQSKEYSFKLKNLPHPFYIRGNSSDKLVIDQVFYQKDYDISLSFIPEIILDCGANIGLASIYFKNKYPNSKIISIEPENDNFNLLKKNLAPYNNVFFENKGLWSEKCYLNIFQGEDNLPWSFYVKPTLTKTNTSIEAIGVDDIFKKYNLAKIDLLKIDIEGAEYELFEKNYDKWLPKVRVIIIELHDRFKPLSSKTFLKALSEYNFNIYFKGENIIAEKIE